MALAPLLTYLVLKILLPLNLGQRSLKVIEIGTIRQPAYGFLLLFWSNNAVF